jgi:hypothetical protein
MVHVVWSLSRDGFCMKEHAVDKETIFRLLQAFHDAFETESESIRARSSRGHVYAARNLIDSIPEVTAVWNSGPMFELLSDELGKDFGLVRALFFDKPPERSWSLPWHKDTSIAVMDNKIPSSIFTRPTLKADVPHVIAHDDILKQMLTLRIHLDDVTDENGPLRVIPGSHVSCESEGAGVDQAVTIYALAGDVLAMRPLISHASGASVEGTTRHRRILHLEFAASNVLPDGYRWYNFVRPSGGIGTQ